MSGEPVRKLRVVRCPKCRLLLPEYPEYDVYKCGGCGTKLQAKKRKSEAVNAESNTQETDSVPRNASVVVSGDEQYSNTKQQAPHREDGSSDKTTTSSSGECYSDGNVRRGQNENGEYIGDQLQPFSLSDEELESEVDIYKLSLRRHRVSNNSTRCEIEEIKSGNLLSEGSKEASTCASSDENDNSEKSALARVMSEMKITGSDSEVAEESNTGNVLPAEAKEESTSGSDGERADNNNKSAPGGANPEAEINGSLLLKGAEELKPPEVEITKSDFEGSEELNAENLLVKEAEAEAEAEGELISEMDGEDANNDKLSLVGENLEVEVTESTYITKISSTAHDKVEEVTSGNHASSNELQKQDRKSIIRHSFERVRSGNTLNTAELINHSSELRGTLGGFSKSPTTRSSYAYDGRENQNKVLETARYVRRHQTRTERSEELLPSRMPPFHQSGSQSRYQNSSSSSNQMRGGELYGGSSFLSPDSSREDTNREKMKLLRMIHKLQDQLNRTRYASGETNGNRISAYHHSHEHLHEGRFRRGQDYPRCNGRCRHDDELNSRRRHKFSRIPYPDEATSSAAQYVDHHSCSHCYPKPRHFSTDLPPHSHFHHLGRDCFSSCSRHSYHSSPQWFSPSSSDDLKHRAHKVRRYIREKHHSAKRNCRPVAGGAPFVTCCKCLNLLQLPADFLLSKGGRRRLKCGKCSEVLEFSLRNGSLVSYSPNASLGPPSSHGDLTSGTNLIDGRQPRGRT